MKIKKFLGQKNPWRNDAVASRENMMNKGKLSPVIICMDNHFASSYILVMTLKIILIYVLNMHV